VPTVSEQPPVPAKPMIERLPPTWRNLLVIMISSTVTGATLSFSFPLLSLILERHDVSADMIGLSAASNSAAIFLMAPWLPRVIGYLGPVRSIAVGQLICIACFALLPLHVAATPWFGLRFVLGIGTVITWVASEAAVNMLAADGQRGRIMGLYATVFCFGYAAGPSLIAWTGSDGMLPFVVAIGLLTLSLLPLPLARHLGAALGHAGRLNLLEIWRLTPRPLLAILAFGFVEMSCFSLMPLYGLNGGHDEAGAMLLLTMLIAGNIIFQLPIGWLSDHWPRDGVLAGCALISLLGFAFWPIVLAKGIAAWPVLLIQGGALGGLYTTSLTLIGQHFRGQDLAIANTALVMMYQLGAVLGPAVAGWSMAGMSAAILPLVLGSALALYLVIASFWVWRERPGVRRS
jgi:MFS family permease